MLTVIARIEAKKDKIELVKEELLRLIEPTRKEKGCIQYDLHQDNVNPEFFTYYENWETRELWQDHMKTDHLVRYMKIAEDVVASFVVNELTKIG